MNDILKDECSLTPFDAADYLDSSKAQSELLIDAFQSGNPAYVTHAFKIIARARGLHDLKSEVSLQTAMSMVKQLDLKLSLSPQV